MPVLLTRTSPPPKRSNAVATSCSAAAGPLASAARTATRSPTGPSSRFAASRTSCRLLERTTDAPSSRKRAAAALPIPPPPPVITTTLSRKSSMRDLLQSSFHGNDLTTNVVSAQTSCYPRAMPPRVPEPHLAAWRGVLNTHAAVVGAVEEALAEAGLPPLAWYDVLWAIRRVPGRRIRMAELASSLTVSRGGLTKLADRLEDAGLISREAAED